MDEVGYPEQKQKTLFRSLLHESHLIPNTFVLNVNLNRAAIERLQAAYRWLNQTKEKQENVNKNR